VKKSPKQSRWGRYFRSYNFLGFVVGSIFVFLSFLPSLLPRGWVLQGVLSALLFSIGYGFGALLSVIIREFKPSEPSLAQKRLIKKITAGVVALVYLISAVLGLHWQTQTDKLVSQPSENPASIIGITIVLLLMTALLILISRSIISLFRWLRRQILRAIPKKLAYTLACVLTVLILVGLINGVILGGVMDIVNQAFSVKNGTTDSGVTKPTTPELSGSPDSIIPWDTLGRQGRKFVSNGQKVQKISKFSGSQATQPIRVYSGLESANNTVNRADLAVKDLKRAGGFNRKVIVVVTTTGTGWVDEQGVEGLEYMYNGDTAMVSMQYSYLPSWLSFLVDQSKAQDAGVELYNAILGEWEKLPSDNRPKLVVFGESLGSFGSEAAFTGWSAFRATSNGAVYAGPPNFNHLWRPTTANRDPGSPEILPIVEGGRTVRYATKPDDFSIVPLDKWQGAKAAYLQNSSDPIVWWSPQLLFNQPDWLSEKRGADVNTATHWLPIITFWQVSGDMMFSTGVPDNHGHKYGMMPTDAWSYVAPPDGWTSQKTQDLKKFISS
jgi:uncharacterized membrane protein